MEDELWSALWCQAPYLAVYMAAAVSSLLLLVAFLGVACEMVWRWETSGKGLEVKPGACGIECISMPNISACYNAVVGSIQNHQNQLFKTHNSVQIKDLLQQSEKQSTDTKETQSSFGIIITQNVN